MNYTKYIKLSILVSTLAIVCGFMSSCQDDITINRKIDESAYEKGNGVYGYIRMTDNAQSTPVVELYQNKNKPINIYFGLTKAADMAVDVALKVDQTLVEPYNKEHKTSFEMLPSQLVTIEGDGLLLIAPGDTKSYSIDVSINSAGSEMVAGKTYLLPISASSITAGVKFDNTNYMILVKYLGKVENAEKTPNIKIISCMEVNDVNPLNNIEFTLKKSGKQLIDIVILFSGNINYNSETGRAYVNNNENISAILHNRDKYIKPLQDRGIKVVLGILGNHDLAGVATLGDELAVEFAAELKSYCDAYKLDGIFFDDEYTTSGSAPGFVSKSSDAAARLVYETKRAMPDKLCMVYIYGMTSRFTDPVYGVNPGDFIDYALADYGKTASVSSYLGITTSQLAPYSQEFGLGNYTTEAKLTKLLTDNYGAHMIFALNPFHKDRNGQATFDSRQLPAMGKIASLLFDDELVWSGVKHEKDWK